MKPNLETLRADLAALRALKESRGWEIVRDAFSGEIMAASEALGANADMPEREMHFRRGAISCASSHLRILDVLISIQESELSMASFEEDADSNPSR